MGRRSSHANETQYGLCTAALLPAAVHAHLDYVSRVLYIAVMLRLTFYLGGDSIRATDTGFSVMAM